jgi:hypothetical protein
MPYAQAQSGLGFVRCLPYSTKLRAQLLRGVILKKCNVLVQVHNIFPQKGLLSLTRSLLEQLQTTPHAIYQRIGGDNHLQTMPDHVL